jgi:L-fucose isomerase
MSVNRLIGEYPKIGIRPAIDGRRKGVREALEDQTMNMARSAAEFLSKNLRYPNGEPVKCVIADTCIGGVAEAAQTAEKFAREGVGVSITVTPCWCYVLKQWIWIHLFLKQFGVLMALNAPGGIFSRGIGCS